MPDRHSLKVGDRIRLLSVPTLDLEQRDRERREGVVEMPGWTADTLEQIIARDPVVVIGHIDEFGSPWFECELPGDKGQIDYHSIAILEDESWVRD